MKLRIISFILALIMLVSFTSCSLEQKLLNSEAEILTYEHGNISNNVYISNLNGMRFSPGPNWNFDDIDALLALMDLSTDSYENDDTMWCEISERSSIYDMKATDPATGNNVIICYDNLSKIKDGKDYDETGFAEKTKESIENSTSYENNSCEISTKDFGNFSWTVLKSVSFINGADVIQTYNYRKIDNFMLTVIITSYNGEASIESIEKCFSKK